MVANEKPDPTWMVELAEQFDSLSHHGINDALRLMQLEQQRRLRLFIERRRITHALGCRFPFFERSEKKTSPPPPHPIEKYTLAQLREMYPTPVVEWHDDELRLSNGYVIAADRVDTKDKLIEWLLHLSEKAWVTPEMLRLLAERAAERFGWKFPYESGSSPAGGPPGLPRGTSD